MPIPTKLLLTRVQGGMGRMERDAAEPGAWRLGADADAMPVHAAAVVERKVICARHHEIPLGRHERKSK